uniref:DUF834 domain-containing protein n=1 Tax=Oryza rufipogon TaxID=4529 RepID=A0A0E0NU61_ORYRU
MAAAGIVAAATLDPAWADLRVEAGRSGAVVEAGGVQGVQATAAGGRGGDRRRRGTGLAVAGGGEDWWQGVGRGGEGGGGGVCDLGHHRIRVGHRRIWSQVRERRRERGGEAGAARGDAAGGMEASSVAWRRRGSGAATGGGCGRPFVGAVVASNSHRRLGGDAVRLWARWLKPCRAFGRFDDDDAVGTVSLLEGVVMALSHLPHKSPGVNLAPASDERRWRYTSLFGSKAFFPWCSARPKPLGSTSFCGGRHTLRLLLRIKLELLAVGVLRRLATMTCCSLFQRVGAGYVKEVALWWLG